MCVVCESLRVITHLVFCVVCLINPIRRVFHQRRHKYPIVTRGKIKTLMCKISSPPPPPPPPLSVTIYVLLSAHLSSNLSSTRQDALAVVKALASQCSDPGPVQTLTKQLFITLKSERLFPCTMIAVHGNNLQL